MRPLLIGLDNPHSSDPRDALAPYPKNATGWRIWQMLHSRTGATERQYMKRFDRQNFQDGVQIKRGSTVVCLGDKVRRILGLPKLLLHPIVADGVEYRQVPHPSGVNRWYNDPAQRELVAILLEDLYRGQSDRRARPRLRAAGRLSGF